MNITDDEWLDDLKAESVPDDMAQMLHEEGIPHPWGKVGKNVFTEYLDYCKTVENNRTVPDILAHLKLEVAELDEEIEKSTNGEPAGADGIAGEAVDVILCALDVISRQYPDLTGAELQAIMGRKLMKWKNKYSTTGK